MNKIKKLAISLFLLSPAVYSQDIVLEVVIPQSALPAGPQGPVGPQGPIGPQGIQGPQGATPDLSDIYARLEALESSEPTPDPEPVPDPTPDPDPIPPISGAPYDLGPLPEFVADIEWPVGPTITNTVAVSTDAGWTDQNNTRYVVTAGTYSAKTISCNDCEFLLDDNAVINGHLTINGTRVSWKGGQKIGNGGIHYGGASDLLIDNLNALLQGDDNFGFFQGVDGFINRVAIINSTLRNVGVTTGRGWLIYTTSPWWDESIRFTARNLIIANVKFDSNAQTVRLQHVEDLVIVDSYFNPSNGSTNAIRLHSSKDIYMRDSVVVGGSSYGGFPHENGLFERITIHDMYGILFSNGITYEGTNLVVNNSQGYATSGGGTLPLGAATGTNPPMLSWDGVTLPDASGYGADH